MHASRNTTAQFGGALAHARDLDAKVVSWELAGASHLSLIAVAVAQGAQVGAARETVLVSKHRHEQFREAWAVVRVDGFHLPDADDQVVVTDKEVWLSAEKAEAEVERLNALREERDGADNSVRHHAQYTPLEREG